MGVKNIATFLNQRRIFTRDGGRCGIGQVHRILTRTTYIGRHEFNKRAKNKALKPISEIVTVEVPPADRSGDVRRCEAHLRARNPKVTPARVVSGSTLLTGICFCADCGGAMTLRTGTGGGIAITPTQSRRVRARPAARAARSRWRSWITSSRSTSPIVCSSRRGSRRFWHPWWIAGRSARSAAASISPS
jgi:hypothetical protein